MMFAIGWAIHPTGDSGQIALDLRKPRASTWESWWKKNGWDTRCFDEFWSKHLPKLDAMQDPQAISVYVSRDSMMAQIVTLLKSLEAKYDTIVPLFDTVSYDSVWMDLYLGQCGFQPLMYRYDGGMSWPRDVTGFFNGVCKFTPNTPEQIRSVKKGELESKIPGWKHEDAHFPQSDAIGILGLFIQSVLLAEQSPPLIA